MPVRHRFVYEWPSGVTPVTFDTWIAGLSQEEKQEFGQAKLRQIAHRQNAIDQGAMIIDRGSYVWTDQQTATINKPTDDVWHKYFQRYLKETQTTFRIEEEQC